METAVRAVDAQKVDNGQRKSFTDLRAEILEQHYGLAMTSFHNGYFEEAAAWLVQAASAASNDRRVVSALMAIDKCINEDNCDPVEPDEITALEDLLDRAKLLVDEEEA